MAYYTALPYNIGMVFIETSVFTRLIADYLTDDEYAGLQSFLLQRPDVAADCWAQSSEELAASENSGGEFLVKARAVESELSIIGMSGTMKSGC